MIMVVVVFCLGLGVGLFLIGQDLFGSAKPTATPSIPAENAP